MLFDVDGDECSYKETKEQLTSLAEERLQLTLSCSVFLDLVYHPAWSCNPSYADPLILEAILRLNSLNFNLISLERSQLLKLMWSRKFKFKPCLFLCFVVVFLGFFEVTYYCKCGCLNWKDVQNSYRIKIRGSNSCLLAWGA